eukprot:6056902-Alexandrium_andersonii.AAC.1
MPSPVQSLPAPSQAALLSPPQEAKNPPGRCLELLGLRRRAPVRIIALGLALLAAASASTGLAGALARADPSGHLARLRPGPLRTGAAAASPRAGSSSQCSRALGRPSVDQYARELGQSRGGAQRACSLEHPTP